MSNFSINKILENFIRKIENLNSEPIDVLLVASNYIVDAFTTAAFSVNMTSDTPIVDCDKVPFIKVRVPLTADRSNQAA